MTNEYALDPSGSAGRRVVPGDRTDVCDDDAARFGDSPVDQIEARIVNCEPLDVLVNLETGAAAGEGPLEIVEVVRVVEMHRGERHAEPVQFACRRAEPRVDLA